MASIVSNQPTVASRYARIPAWLRELDFVTDGFTWLFRLMSRGAEPLMTLSTIYVIIEAGVPAVSVAWLHFLAVAIMISAPEIILPGGFILAGEIRAQGNRRAWLLYSMCWLFVILTSATLADLFIWHFTGGAFAALMWSRCAAAVGYSILFRVITYHRHSGAALASPSTIAAPDVLALVEQKLTDQARQFQIELEQRLNALSEQVQATFQREISQLSEQLFTQKPEESSPDSSADSSEQESQGAAQGAAPGRRYLATIEEAARISGLSVSQLKRRIKSGEIETGSNGKVRVKSLQNLQQKPRKVQREPARKPALSLVKKEQHNGMAV